MKSVSAADGLAFRGERVGKYEILTRLSVGGMAELFLAFTRGPGGFRKYVVLKRILPEVRGDDQFRKMFLDEARITAALGHPNIAQVFDLGEEEQGLYLSMEFIQGRNLSQITIAQFKRRALLPVGFCAAVARDVCLALQHAHTFAEASGKPAPVIHRDVAQKNIMVTYDGVTKLLDFGIAKAKNSLGRTTAGMVKGTTGYMSPEQVQAMDLDGRSDVFSMGVVLYEMVTGRRLFSAATEEEEMRKILSGPIPEPKSIVQTLSDGLQGVILKALARDRKERFSSARDMARALEEVMGKDLYDQEQIAGFMRSLFSKKMAATRALIESAEKVSGELEDSVVRVFHEEDSGDPQKESARADFPTERVSDKQEKVRKPDRAPARKKPGKPARNEPPTPAYPVSAVLGADRLDPFDVSPRADSLMRKLYRDRVIRAAGGVIVASMVIGGMGAFLYRNALETAKNRARLPAAAVISAQAPGPAPRQVAARPEPLEEAPPPRKAPTTARGPGGTLTLVTKPSCEVWLNHRTLGRTPMFDVALPVGQHVLELRGEDRLVRRLKVTIRLGKNTARRIELGRLPRVPGA